MTITITRTTGALATLALGLLLPASASAAEFTVNRNDDLVGATCPDTCTLRAAIEAANANDQPDTITFDLAEGDRVIELGGTQLTIANDVDGPDLTIDGDVDGTPGITVDADGSSRVFEIASGAEATLEGLVITGGTTVLSGDGGGIFNDDGMLTVINSTISGNRAAGTGIGGGIVNNGTLTVTNSTISDNSATGGFGGGGIFNDGTLTVTNSTISGNRVSRGGGILNWGTVTVADSTISGNVTTLDGGGIFNDRDGTLTVKSSTISGNSTSLGGGINNFEGTLTVANSTISGNSGASQGGGIYNRDDARLKGTIVAGNTATSDADCFNLATLTSQGFNLDGDGTCGFETVAVADVLVTDGDGDPLLADNSGPTQTIALLDSDTNPAIDAIPLENCTFPDDVPEPGDQDVPVATDQRGVDRPQPFPDGNCDIGAFELVQDASVTIADVIELFDHAVAGGSLMGAGPGGSAAGRLNALRNMLLAAGELLEQGEIDAACTQLQDAADRTDGAAPPPDFVQGDAAADLLDAITAVQDELGCFV